VSFTPARKHLSDTVRKQAELAGEILPAESIEEEPELNEGLALYLSAYYDLDTERSHGLCLTPIPSSSIVQYAETYDFDEEQTENLVHYIKKMDAANLEKLAKKKPKAKRGKN